jgi:hypothetical protein
MEVQNMRTRSLIILCLCCIATTPLNAKKPTCVTIQDGTLAYSAGHYLEGQPLQTGYDIFGYNYQAHMFSGSYANIYLGRKDGPNNGLPPYEGDTAAYLAAHPEAATKWYWPYRDVQVEMTWNDAWLSNKDCDGDGLLDRHYGLATYIGSGAWETNHQSATYVGDDGRTYKWNDFVKIVAVPADAIPEDTGADTGYGDTVIWHAADGAEIGPSIWGEFAVIQEVYNDQGTSDHGVLYRSPVGPGFGKFAP